jgi:hypothetical protein
VERTLLLTFAAVYLYLHAVPHDLWCRDFIPLTAVLAAPAALGLSRSGAWRSRSWLSPLAWALAVFLCVVPAVLRALYTHAGATRQVPVMLIWSAAAPAALVFAVLRWLPAGRFRDRMRRAGPFAAAFGVAMNFWLLLPYPAIYLNLQFPNYEIDRAHRERVGAWMRDSIPPGPVLTARPEEISIYSGFPAVALPGLVRQGTLERLVARYGVRYLLLEPGTLPDSVLRTLTLHPVGEKEGARLFAF